MDLCPSNKNLERFLCPDGNSITNELTRGICPRYQRMNNAIGFLLDDYSLVNFVPLDLTNSDSMTYLLFQIDLTFQYGEEKEAINFKILIINYKSFSFQVKIKEFD